MKNIYRTSISGVALLIVILPCFNIFDLNKSIFVLLPFLLCKNLKMKITFLFIYINIYFLNFWKNSVNFAFDPFLQEAYQVSHLPEYILPSLILLFLSRIDIRLLLQIQEIQRMQEVKDFIPRRTPPSSAQI